MPIGGDRSRTDVMVVYQPSGEKHRATIQITIRPASGKGWGKSTRDQLRRVMEEVVRLQDMTKRS